MNKLFLSFLFLPFVPAFGKEPADSTPPVREMSADRPDTTESPFTVPAGYWQVEMEAISITRDQGRTSEDWGSINLKYGLSDSVDLQWVTPAWHHEHGVDGWTDMELRLKWNLTGQDGKEGLAMGLLPYLKLPTASRGLGNGNVEGGLIFPLSTSLGKGCDLSWMAEAAVIRNDDDDGWTGALTLSASLGFDLTGKLSAFTETVVTLPLEGDAEVYFNTGLILSLEDNWTIDTGVNLGLNGAADDVRFFAGTSFRF